MGRDGQSCTPNCSRELHIVTEQFFFLFITGLPYFYKLANKRVMEFLWISGHRGRGGNDIADYLVRAGAGQLIMSQRKYFRLWEEKNNEKVWTGASATTAARKPIPLLGLLTSHAEINYYQHKTGKADNPDCSFRGMEQKTIRQILVSLCSTIGHEEKNLRVALGGEAPNTRNIIQYCGRR